MKYKGSGLVEYAVPLALIGLVVGVGVYSLASSGNLLNMFLGSSNSKYDASTKSTTLNHKENVTASVFSNNPNVPDPVIQSTGTPAKPVSVSNCTAGTCSIDFGSFTLTGIPENFSDYVAANASSGGTDTISDIFMQISNQLEAQGDSIGAAQYKDLANLGHFLAVHQNQLETIMKTTSNSGYSADAFRTALENTPSLPALPANISSILTNYSEYSEGSNPYRFMEDCSLSDAQTLYKSGRNSPSVYKTFPTRAMIGIYNSILENPNYSDDLKNITIALMRSLDDLNFNLENNVKYAYFEDTPNVPHFDIVTGEPIDYTYSVPDNVVNSILKPTSPFTHLDSRLLCAVGLGNDVNNACSAN